MRKVQASCSLTRMAEGHIARSAENPAATAFGKTEDEAGGSPVDAMRTYVRPRPDRAGAAPRPAPAKELVPEG